MSNPQQLRPLPATLLGVDPRSWNRRHQVAFSGYLEGERSTLVSFGCEIRGDLCYAEVDDAFPRFKEDAPSLLVATPGKTIKTLFLDVVRSLPGAEVNPQRDRFRQIAEIKACDWSEEDWVVVLEHINRERATLGRIARRTYSGKEGEDQVNDFIENARHHLIGYDPSRSNNLPAYIRKKVDYASRNAKRKAQALWESQNEQLGERVPTDLVAAEKTDECQLLDPKRMAAYMHDAGLSKKSAFMLWAVSYWEYTHEELANALRMKRNTVSQRIRRAQVKMAKHRAKTGAEKRS